MKSERKALYKQKSALNLSSHSYMLKSNSATQKQTNKKYKEQTNWNKKESRDDLDPTLTESKQISHFTSPQIRQTIKDCPILSDGT